MKIQTTYPDPDVDRMYCPSTDEVIFSPDVWEANEDAEACIAYWHGDALKEPIIKDSKLEAAWDKHLGKWDKLEEELTDDEIVEKFLKAYRNSKWRVILTIEYGIACGPVSCFVYWVMKEDTVIEEDPDSGTEEQNVVVKTNKESISELISRTIRSIEEGTFENP